MLAQKLRPKGQPGFEMLHRQAFEIQSRITQQLLAKEEAIMKVCCSSATLELLSMLVSL